MSPGRPDGPIPWIVHRAANLAPEAFRHRLEEEWLADLSALDGPMMQLRFASGCCRAALAMRVNGIESVPRRQRMREDACTWLERLRRGLREEEGVALREWLKRRSHREGIARAAAQRVSPEDLAVLREMFQVAPGWVIPRRGRSPTINAAAALMATCIAALPMLYTHYSMPGLILGPAVEGSFMEARGTVYTSGERTLRRLDLPDGTQVVMNRGTRIAVLYSDNIRSVLLVRGEATFTVPPQTLRSFYLTVGDRSFGTEASTFNVRLMGKDALEFTVLEGSVTAPESPAAADPAAPREGNGRLSVSTLLNAGQVLDSRPGAQSARTLSQVEAQARIAWQRG